ncbi:class I SAM-dependent methyltransferase [Xenorhabdus sp. PB62.4]|uniref:class I SAM-dependent methyltransferase n=1 Tax=Xenorhabdus sp. PB62.4 TaxID=1851573 RepID=UPI0016569434|nr:class I SAM-dependent methyltransferase [Xenorhabdus sp. PB62.4]MBC8953650.1 SAM-dependent methyltransferase [Xenorhabdus sp. PB62.4]
MFFKEYYEFSSTKENTHTPKFNPSTFDEYAGLYEKMSSWPYRKELELPTLGNLLGDLSGLSVLDFGCGPGAITRWLKGRKAKCIVGQDISEGMLNYARRREEKEKDDIKYISKVSEDYNEYFDVVLAVYVMPYAANHEELLKMSQTMARVLKPGGRLITLPIHPQFSADPEYYRPFGFRLIEEQPRADGSPIRLHICQTPYDINIQAYYWSHSTLENTLQQSGFHEINWKPLNIPANPDLQDLFPYVKCPHAAIIEGIKGEAC